MPTGVQLPLKFETRSLHGREDFIVTPGTMPAVALIDSWPDWPAPCVSIFGPAGSGKSHLAAIWQDRSAASKIDISELDSTIDHLQNAFVRDTGGFVLRLPDDGDLSSSIQERLFHLLNTIREQQGCLLLITRQSPARIDVALPDLKSRLRAIPAVEIPAPDDDLLRGILLKMFNDRQISISTDVVDYMVLRMERSFDGARHLVDQLDRLALSEKRAITIPFVRRVLDAN